MSHTLTYHSIRNVQLCLYHIGKGTGPYAPAPAWAHTHTPAPVDAHAHTNAPPHAQANATAPADTHANATAPHPRYFAAGSTSVICKMTILRRWSPFMDDLWR
ncbi:hypothetical protein O181_082565 [Austropuccinia psidii MF-1]|uniref:Uncharacterized protein n=1 Tax=Austropuccinia psidii MF-1 TaxID=1389203 RepID=A0A9Q3FLD9_9BASI|nr:hypothetical protein [Austropuccinia psidii MF-1]